MLLRRQFLEVSFCLLSFPHNSFPCPTICLVWYPDGNSTAHSITNGRIQRMGRLTGALWNFVESKRTHASTKAPYKVPMQQKDELMNAHSLCIRPFDLGLEFSGNTTPSSISAFTKCKCDRKATSIVCIQANANWRAHTNRINSRHITMKSATFKFQHTLGTCIPIRLKGRRIKVNPRDSTSSTNVGTFECTAT